MVMTIVTSVSDSGDCYDDVRIVIVMAVVLVKVNMMMVWWRE